MRKPKILVILGPNASGKSTLAVELAKKFRGEVISADSRQVYKGLDIGAGKITKKEMRGVPHYLLDVASPRRTFTAAQYQKLARAVLKKILAKGKLPVICGGTGFYIDAFLHDYELPQVPPDPKLRRRFDKLTAEHLFKMLRKLDPKRAAAIDRHNKRRLVRALEIILKTGKPVPGLISASVAYSAEAASAAKAGKTSADKRTPALRSLSEGGNGGITKFSVLKIGIKPLQGELKGLIHARLLKRLEQEMVKEVKNLHAKGVSWQRLDDLGLEYRWVSRYLRGFVSKEEMIKALEREIWRYAKRQMTWFKKDKEIRWAKNKKEAIKVASRFLKS